MAPERFTFPRRQRLTRSADLARVYAEGKRIRTRHLDVRGLASLRTYGRVGIVVPRFGHSAVDRNTVKRRLRELVRMDLLPGLSRMDLVLKATPAAYRADFEALRFDVASVRERTREREAGTPAPGST